MFAVRIYLAILDLFLLAACLTSGRTGPLELVVLTCPLLYMTLEMREELRASALAISGNRLPR